jgi:hypothetical protein
VELGDLRLAAGEVADDVVEEDGGHGGAGGQAGAIRASGGGEGGAGGWRGRGWG